MLLYLHQHRNVILARGQCLAKATLLAFVLTALLSTNIAGIRDLTIPVFELLFDYLTIFLQYVSHGLTRLLTWVGAHKHRASHVAHGRPGPTHHTVCNGGPVVWH